MFCSLIIIDEQDWFAMAIEYIICVTYKLYFILFGIERTLVMIDILL